MQIFNKFLRFSKLYIIFSYIVLFLIIFSTSYLHANAFKVSNIEISSSFELNFQKNAVIDDGFKTSFINLLSMITTTTDKKKIKNTPIIKIKEMIDSFTISKEKFVDNEYIAILETTFNKKKVLKFLENKNILHVGIGNSYVAKKLLSYNKIDGISLSQNELDYASKLNLSNYNFFFQNKYANQNLFDDKLNFYNIIIDINLKSFGCCEVAFNKMFKKYVKIINKDGKIITSRSGLKWSRIIKPVLSFSFKNFFYKRLKEFDGPASNILSIQNCEEISKKFNLDIDLSDQNLVIFTKK